MYYYQQGGKSQGNSQDELLLRAIFGFYGYMKSKDLNIDIQECVMQIAQLISQKPETILQIAQSNELVDAGAKELQSENPEAFELLALPGAATEIIKLAVEAASQAQVQAARHGAKLNYIKRLKGECPTGYEMAYYKAGGTVCPVCQKKAEEKRVQSAKCGKKMKKGSVSKAMNGIRTEIETKKEGGPAGTKPTPKKQDRGLSVRSVKPGSDAAKAVKAAGYYYTNDLPYYVTRYITNAALPDTVYTYGVDDPDMGMEVASAASPNMKGLRADLKNPRTYARLRNIYELAR